ncbi:MAG: hypothetical protein KZQ88_18945 [Candidatus Thiodiazotropha sp. (ex Dulcina madagascariensis)]|nr:hypothetical protein [Candidatus Thiodiazotropha sp. (ex Dulcina madagascariensis)]MCU7926452.1 hypothetical protein [Candidatus Thiodiazotropha sp. (ex Dulcina madagascariensis)]
MAGRRRLHLLLPSLFWPVATKQFDDGAIRPKVLAKVLARADRETFHGIGLAETLFHLFGITTDAHQDLPVGAVSYYGAGGDPGESCWASTTPAHLLADRDRLLLARLDRSAVQQAEAEQLAALFNTHFKDEGLFLVTKSPTEWYLRLAKCPDLKKTFSIESAIGRHIEEYLPDGVDGKIWRSILTEIQMLFFQSDINQRRDLAGEIAINCLWISGFGCLPRVQGVYDAIYSEQSLAKGLARLAGIPSAHPPSTLADIVDSGRDIIVVISHFIESELDVDHAKWKEALISIDENLACLLKEDKRHGKGEIIIYPCDGTRFHLTKEMLIRRFWKRGKGLNCYT